MIKNHNFNKQIIELSVIVPCFNEEGNVEELAKRVGKVFEKINKKCELIFVDDNSSDNTLLKLKYLQKKFSFINFYKHKSNLGMSEAWRTGLSNANGYYVSIIDADLQYQPEDIYFLYKRKIENVADVVQGSRNTIGRKKDIRFIYSIFLNKILNFSFGMNLNDNKSGFLVTTKDVFKDMLSSRFNYKYFQTFLLVSANSKNYTIYEKKVLFDDRLIGKSFINLVPIKLFFNLSIDFIKAIYEFNFSKKKITLTTLFSKKSFRKTNRSITSKILLLIYFYSMPLHAWILSRNTRSYFDELDKTQWLSRDEIQALQLEKLKKLLTHSYHNSDYYNELFNQYNIHPKDIASLDDLKKIPFLTKQIVRENLNFGILAKNIDYKNILKIVTSGSTGEPFVCYADKYQLEMRWASTLRSLEWTGYRFGDKTARLWHQTIGMSKIQVIKEKIDAFISRRIFIPAYQFSNEKLSKYLNKLKKFNPVLIDGYAESFNFLAEYVNANPEFKISPKAIVSSAQILPDISRRIIEDKFNTKVFDKYGSREFSGIAYESAEKNVHLVVAENYIVEIIRNNKTAKPGEIGEVVITDLNNYCMPFIRYKIGDLAVQLDKDYISPCGRNLPAIGRIEGRVQAIIFGSNNNYLPGTFFAHFFKEYPHIIKQYQIIQEKADKIILKIVKGSRYTKEGMGEVITNLLSHLGEETNLNIQYVKVIKMIRTGKQQGAISKLKIDFQKL